MSVRIRRSLQFSLLTLLVAVTCCALIARIAMFDIWLMSASLFALFKLAVVWQTTLEIGKEIFSTQRDAPAKQP